MMAPTVSLGSSTRVVTGIPSKLAPVMNTRAPAVAPLRAVDPNTPPPRSSPRSTGDRGQRTSTPATYPDRTNAYRGQQQGDRGQGRTWSSQDAPRTGGYPDRAPRGARAPLRGNRSQPRVYENGTYTSITVYEDTLPARMAEILLDVLRRGQQKQQAEAAVEIRSIGAGASVACVKGLVRAQELLAPGELLTFQPMSRGPLYTQDLQGSAFVQLRTAAAGGSAKEGGADSDLPLMRQDLGEDVISVSSGFGWAPPSEQLANLVRDGYRARLKAKGAEAVFMAWKALMAARYLLGELEGKPCVNVAAHYVEEAVEMGEGQPPMATKVLVFECAPATRPAPRNREKQAAESVTATAAVPEGMVLVTKEELEALRQQTQQQQQPQQEQQQQ